MRDESQVAEGGEGLLEVPAQPDSDQMEREGDHEVAMQLASDSVQGQEIYSHLRQ